MIMRSQRTNYVVAAACVLVLNLVRGTHAQSQWNPNQQAIDKCEQDLTFRLNNDPRGRDPRANLDYRSLDVRQQGRDSVRVAGRGSFSRDRFDRGRDFTFDCTVDMSAALS